ncbi:hypothetical protein ACFV16_30390 [Streptomyces massasporeus]|uniref:hypothetical protein n=1 Tax=Streptomyces massasporeus TaxID=67324 RepID=UPI003695A984
MANPSTCLVGRRLAAAAWWTARGGPARREAPALPGDGSPSSAKRSTRLGGRRLAAAARRTARRGTPARREAPDPPHRQAAHGGSLTATATATANAQPRP